jgi:hypothetical protein
MSAHHMRAKNAPISKGMLDCGVCQTSGALSDSPFCRSIILGLNCAQPLDDLACLFEARSG